MTIDPLAPLYRPMGLDDALTLACVLALLCVAGEILQRVWRRP